MIENEGLILDLEDINLKRLIVSIGLLVIPSIVYIFLILIELPIGLLSLILLLYSIILGILSMYAILSVFEHERKIDYIVIALEHQDEKSNWKEFWKK